jgi:hypothetical protein
VLLTASSCSPDFLSDDGNSFLKGFVNQELLSLLGVIVTITLASAGNLHLELNKLQDRAGRDFPKTRKSVRMSAYSLIIIFAFGAALVIIKPLLGPTPRMTAMANSFAITIILFSLGVLFDLIRTTFSIPASTTIPERTDDKPPPSPRTRKAKAVPEET